MIHGLKNLSDLKNNGTCFDSDGTDQFSCTCELPFDGVECQTDLCENTVCQNNGTCDVKSINGVLKPTCDCPDNYVGESGDMPAVCDGKPCQNGGTCSGETQADCSQVGFVTNLERFLSL